MGWLETQLPPVVDFSPCFHKHQHLQIEPWNQPTNKLWQSSIRNPAPENCSPSFLTNQRTSFNPANFSLPSLHSCPQPLVARVELCRVFFLRDPHTTPWAARVSLWLPLFRATPTLQNLNGFRSSWCAKMRFPSIAWLPRRDVIVQVPAWFLPWPAACHSTPVVSRTTFGHSSTVKLLRSSVNQVFCLLSRTNGVWTSWGIAPLQVAGGGWGLSMQTVTKCELIPLDLIFFTG